MVGSEARRSCGARLSTSLGEKLEAPEFSKERGRETSYLVKVGTTTIIRRESDMLRPSNQPKFRRQTLQSRDRQLTWSRIVMFREQKSHPPAIAAP